MPGRRGQLLTLLERRTFGKREFFETQQGACRLMPPLPQLLAELAPATATLAAPVVEQVAHRLADGERMGKRPLTIPTLLTEANRSAGRDSFRTMPKRETTVELVMPKACRACGVLLARQDRDHCDACMPEVVQATARALGAAGQAKLTELRALGEDPAHGEAVNRQRGQTMAQRRREVLVWNAANGAEADPEVFRREILPGLQDVSLHAMAEATGLTKGYCSFVRRGLKVPHRRHWPQLRALVN